jgi:genome maintenance exonuclease 1
MQIKDNVASEGVNKKLEDLAKVGESWQSMDTEFGRYYSNAENVRYPSITTVTGYLSREAIQAWRDKIGEENAERVSNEASSFGTKLHETIESYLLDGDVTLHSMQPSYPVFVAMKDEVDNIEPVLIEACLFSHEMQVAGRVDCVGYYNGKLSIIDFKSSRKTKKREWIHNYILQESAYSFAIEENTGIAITNLVTLIGCRTGVVQVFEEERLPEYKDDFLSLREEVRLDLGY